MLAVDLTDDARHWVRVAAAVKCGSRIVDVDTVERSSKTVRVAFASNLAIGNDIETGLFLLADRDERRVILRLCEEFRGDPP